MKRSINWRRVGIISLVCLPALVLVGLLVRFAVNVPFWDQWELVAMFEKWHAGTLGFADFFAQHNEHRLLFPRLIMFSLAVTTGWNTFYEVGLNVVLAAVTFWFLWLILRNTFKTLRMRVIVAASVSAVVFSPLQFENWMWGWQIQWFLNVLGLVVAVWAFSTWRAKPWTKFVVAGLAATVATYSLASGFFVWLVCLPLLWFAKDLRPLLWAWILAAITVIGSHYIGYVDPAYHPSKLIFLKEPVQFIVYFFVYSGRPLIIDFSLWLPIAAAYFTIFAAALGYMLKKHTTHLTTTLLPWLSLGLYGLFAAGSTSISRLGFGVEQAYSSRYSTLSSLLLIAGIALLCKIIELESGKVAARTLRNVTVGLFVGAMLLVGANYAKGALQMRDRHDHLTKVQACARTATSANDECLLLLYPNKEAVWPRLEYLRSIHWGGL